MSKAIGPTRRQLLQTGAVVGGTLLGGHKAVWAQAKAAPTKVFDFQTYADMMAKVEQEGQFVFYCHENERSTRRHR